MKIEKYKVVVREKQSHAIVAESKVYSNPDSWISACIHKDSYLNDYNLDYFDIEIIEVD